MGRRRITVADIKEVLVAWDAGESVSAIARMFGYTRPTVRKYVHAAEHVGLTRGGARRGEAEWERLTRAAMERVARRRARGPAASAVAAHRDYLDKKVGTVPLSVLHQRLRDEQGLAGELAHVPSLRAGAVAGADARGAGGDGPARRPAAGRGGAGRLLLRGPVARPGRWAGGASSTPS